MTTFARLFIPFCAVVGLASFSGFLPASMGDAHASDPPSGNDDKEDDEAERDDPSFEVVYERKLGDGTWQVIVQNDYGYGGIASGDSKKEAREEGEAMADKWNEEGVSAGCFDLCRVWPGLCD